MSERRVWFGRGGWVSKLGIREIGTMGLGIETRVLSDGPWNLNSALTIIVSGTSYPGPNQSYTRPPGPGYPVGDQGRVSPSMRTISGDRQKDRFC